MKNIFSRILSVRKISVLLFATGTGFFIMTGQNFQGPDRTNNNDPRLTTVYPSGEYKPLLVNINIVFSYQPRIIKAGSEVLSITPNFMVHPSFGTQSGTPITRHPANPLIMFGTATTFRGGSALSSGVYVTTNGGLNWFGSDTLNNGSFNSGSPAPVIDKDGRFIMSFISNTGATATSYSTNSGINWSPAFILPGSTVYSSRPMPATDDILSSPYYGRSYIAYSEFSGVYNNKVVMSFTTNGGGNWSSVTPLSGTVSPAHFHQGTDLKVGPNGDLMVVWANSILTTGLEDSLGFARSTDGGANWIISRNEASDMNGIRTTNLFNGIRANGSPRIDVDKTSGPRRGWIYAVTAEKNVAPATDAADIILHRSTDGGNNWTKSRVNQDTPGNGKLQYFGAVNVDDQGGVNVVYYDTRNSPANDSAQIYVSRSVDGGNTWNDILISDHKFRPKPIAGLAEGFQGDLIGITSGNGKLWPYWCEDISGIYQAWTAEVDINLAPLNSFNLNSPAANSTILAYSHSLEPVTFAWDAASTQATYKFIFGNPTTATRKITIPLFTNSLTLTSEQINDILTELGVPLGDSLTGQWDVWAFRNNLNNDSLKSSNGARAIVLKRGIPPLTAFNLIDPPGGTEIHTSGFNLSNINFKWSSSGPGVTYRWKFGSPSISSVIRLSFVSNISGIDSSLTIANNALDGALSLAGVNAGDSISGEWSVWAYNNFDSVKASQNYPIKFVRHPKGDVLVLYDSLNANCRISRDSVIANLNNLGITNDVYNRKNNTSANAISFRGYKRLIVLGEGSSVMSNVIKDSLKSYLASGTAMSKAKVVIMSEDIGYFLDRSSSVYFDSSFARSILGFSFAADRPGVGGRGITGITINSNLSDSSYGPSTDVIRRSSSIPSAQTYNLYKYRLFADSMNAVGRIAATYNVAIMAADAESLRPAFDSPNEFALKRILNGLIKFVDEIPTSSDPLVNLIPEKFSLLQNYPNPFNPSTTISYSIPETPGQDENVSLIVYDLLGKQVMTLVNEKQSAGNYSVSFISGNLSSGMYLYELRAGDRKQTRRMLLLK